MLASCSNRAGFGACTQAGADLQHSVALQLERAQVLQIGPGVGHRGQPNCPGVRVHMLLPCDGQLLQLQQPPDVRDARTSCGWYTLVSQPEQTTTAPAMLIVRMGRPMCRKPWDSAERGGFEGQEYRDSMQSAPCANRSTRCGEHYTAWPLRRPAARKSTKESEQLKKCAAAGSRGQKRRPSLPDDALTHGAVLVMSGGPSLPVYTCSSVSTSRYCEVAGLPVQGPPGP